MSSRIASILVAALVILGLPCVSSAAIIFDNTPGTGGIAGPGAQLGDEVTGAPDTGRLVTELDIGFSQGNVGPAMANVQAFLYANNGIGGSPGSLLWESAVLSAAINADNSLIAFLVPSVLVPDTFTFTALITNRSGNFGDAPGNSASTGTFVAAWFELAPGVWTSLPPIFGIEARVVAQPVPEPSTLGLLVLGAVALTGVRRRCRMTSSISSLPPNV
jgi:PEP-CTERM motif